MKSKTLLCFLVLLTLVACEKKLYFETASMAPTFQKGDSVTLQEKPAGQLKHGDLAVVALGQPNLMTLVRRVLGLPGDELSVKDGELYRNGKKLKEPYAQGRTLPMNRLRQPVTVPEKSLFLMGDNRENSMDSRYFGPVKFSQIKGTVQQK